MADYDVNKLTKLGALKQLAERVNENFATKESVTTLESRVNELVTTGGEPNKIEKVKVNGQEQNISEDDKSVDIEVPTNVSDLEDYEDYATVEFVNTKIGSVYKPAGSVEFESLPEASSDNLGSVYNITDAFTADEKFVDSERDNEYPAGTNVVVVDVGDGDSEYKYDVLAGFVDLSDYAKITDIVEYEDATTSEHGLMSVEDKQKLDGIEIADDDEVSDMLDDVLGSENE